MVIISLQTRLEEWCVGAEVRPEPPPTPEAFHRLIARGDVLEMLFEDGWWEVRVEEICRGALATQRADHGVAQREQEVEAAAAAGGADEEAVCDELRFVVSSVMYAKAHVVSAAVLRPQWQWSKQASIWRYEIVAGHGFVVPSTGEALFKFAYAIHRSHNDTGLRSGPARPLTCAAGPDPASEA